VALTRDGVRVADGSVRPWNDVVVFRVDTTGAAVLLRPEELPVRAVGYDPFARITSSTAQADAARSALDLVPGYLP